MSDAALGEALDLSRLGPPALPGFRILTERPLGSGAFGQVWEAEKTDDGRTCAVKIFTQTAGLDWGRLEREVKILTRIDDHPHIVNLFHANLSHETHPFYAMQLLRGGSLETRIHPRDPEGRIARNPLLVPIEKATTWFGQIADALRFAHGKGILHCDLKPANVMLDDEDHVKLVDFGQSRLLKSEGSSLGTLDYMAPEQAVMAGDGDEPPTPDVRWDIYSFGVLMYETLTRRLPRADGAQRPQVEPGADLREMLSDYRDYLRRTALTPVRVLRPDVDEDLAAIVEKCLAVEPGSRYDSFEAVLHDFEARDKGQPLIARSADRVYRYKHFVKRRVWSFVLVAVIAAWLLKYQRESNHAYRDLAAFRDATVSQSSRVADLAGALIVAGSPKEAVDGVTEEITLLGGLAQTRPTRMAERLAIVESCQELAGLLDEPKLPAADHSAIAAQLEQVLKLLNEDGWLNGNAQFEALRQRLEGQGGRSTT